MSLYQTILEVFKRWNWKSIDKDNMYSNQCVDWVRQYALDIGCPITTFWNARWFATIWLGKNWERVEGEAWIWDIVVQPRGKYWHIAVVERIGKNTLYVMEQNRDWKANKNNNPKNLGSPVSQGKYKILWDEVYFRPIPKPKKKTPPPNPLKNGKRSNPKSR